MNHREGFTIIELMIVVIIIGLLVVMALPNFMSMKDHAREAGTTENAHTLQLATEDFAVTNDGIYSTAPADLTPLLPGGGMMENTFTHAATEPQYGAAAAAPGQVGIEALVNGGITTGYRITGYGRQATIITLTNGG